ncbi:MAG TPA: LysR family transcriptional regulator [Polyangiaceae bacterium]
MNPALVPALFDAFTVARLGSVGAAARKLGKTPSAVSQQLKNLSALSGVALFERRGRGVRLTAAGERVLPLATRLFDEVETLFRLFGELSGAAQTTLRIAAADYLARPLLVPVLQELAAEGAPFHFEITTAHSEEALERLERGDVELAIVSFSGERAGLETHVLFEQPFYWVAPARRGRQQRKRAGSLTERLASEPLLRLAPGSVGRRLLDEWLDEHGVRVTSTIDVPSVSLLLAYATGGVGVGLIPALSLDTHETRGAVELERAELPLLPVKLVLREGRRRDAAVEHFVERVEREAERRSRRLSNGVHGRSLPHL